MIGDGEAIDEIQNDAEGVIERQVLSSGKRLKIGILQRRTAPDLRLVKSSFRNWHGSRGCFHQEERRDLLPV
jgi:hypothetical protein